MKNSNPTLESQMGQEEDADKLINVHERHARQTKGTALSQTSLKS